MQDGLTIAAIATPAGSGGVGVIRVSGPLAVSRVAALVGRRPDELPDREFVFGRARAGDEVLDEVLVVAMRGPRSFTGEDVAEVHGHGGPVNVGRLLRALLGEDVRLAEPGEFTRRAFENGKLDLLRAEAVVDVIDAGSERALRASQAQLRGALGERVSALRGRAVAVLAEIEASADFPDEDLDFADGPELGRQLTELANDVRDLAATFALGRAMREGVSAALVGPANAGKSSLFNALVGAERAVVTAEPGTTRDFVETSLVWAGIPVTLVDTAGVREATSDAERRGIELSQQRSKDADVRLLVVPPGGQPPAELAANELVVFSKCDLQPDDGGGRERAGLATSATLGRGLDELRAAVVQRAVGAVSEGADGVVVANERQRARLDDAERALRAGARAARGGQPVEVVALEVRAGGDALASVLGEKVGEDLLDELFSRFCIGK